MGNKTICIIAPRFSQFIGGMETHAREMVAFFIKHKDYRINTILTSSNVHGVSVSSGHGDSGLERLIEPVLDGDVEGDAKKILQSSNPNEDIYYLNSPDWLPALAIVKDQFPKARIIVRSGGNDIEAGWVSGSTRHFGTLDDVKRYLIKLINTYAELLIVNSDYSKGRALDLGVKPEKIVKVLGGVNCEKFTPLFRNEKDGRIRIVTVARLVAFKGIEYNLLAVKEAVQKYHLDVRYTVIGEGSERSSLEKIADQLGIAEHVCFMGAVNLDEIPYLLGEQDFFLHLPVYLRKFLKKSSYIHTETMGRSLCEAAACSLPVIASRVGGIPEIVIDGITGFLVSEKNYVGAAEKINILVQNEKLRESLGENARKRAVLSFDSDKIFQRYATLFQHAT